MKKLLFIVLCAATVGHAYGQCTNNGSGNDGCGNTGNGNTGSNNQGSGNTGAGNTGDYNTGSNNNGWGNNGTGNTGNGNTGTSNNGTGNIGSTNTGNGNYGSNNNGGYNTGSNNTGEYNYGSGNNGQGNYGSDNTGNSNIGSLNNGNSNNGVNNNGSSNTGSSNTGSGNYGTDNNGNLNSGSGNTGNGNVGSYNNGNNNAGSMNNGDNNFGTVNTGNDNIGSVNSGNNNYGSGNNGDGNFGASNNGNGNAGSFNTGDSNTGSSNGGNSNIGSMNNGNNNLGSVNNGNDNYGSANSGNYNYGTGNEGDGNWGSLNNGNGNTGTGNEGNSNIGSLNEGQGNAGSNNLGDYNTGSSNIGDGNFGSGNFGSHNTGSNNNGSSNMGTGNSGGYNTGSNNTGDLNNGSGNSGLGNLGSNNVGNENIGSVNTGASNTGSHNNGSVNTGSWNHGDANMGSNNLGNGNTGSNNSGNDNYGVGNIGDGNYGNNNLGNNNQGNDNVGSNNVGNGNVGDGNMGDGNEGFGNEGNNNIGNNHVGDNNEDEWHLKYNKIVPLFFGNFDRLNRIENLTPAQADQSLVYDEYAEGFKVTQQVNATILAGGAPTFNFPAAGDRYELPQHMGAAVGLSVIRNRMVQYETVVRDMQELQERSYVIPMNIRDFDHMRTGDKITFSMQGGLSASLGWSVYGVGFAPSYLVMGGYQATVEKVDEKLVSVQFVRNKMSALGFAVGTFGAQAFTSKAKSESQSFDMYFDIGTTDGAMAYELAIRGRIKDVQEIELKSDAVDTMRTGKFIGRAFKRGYRLALPIVPLLSYSRGNSYEENFSMLTNLKDGNRARTFYGVHLNQTNSRVGSRYTEDYEAFYAASAVSENVQNPRESGINMGLGARFKYKYSRTHTRSNRLAGILSNLKHKTGLEGLLGYEVPYDKFLGYSKVEMDVVWSEDYIRHLMHLAYTNKLEDSFTQYIEKSENPSALKQSLGQIKYQLIEMGNYVFLDASNFVKSLSSIGKKAMGFSDLFKALHSEAKKCGMKVKLVISGRRISKVEKVSLAEKSSACVY